MDDTPRVMTEAEIRRHAANAVRVANKAEAAMAAGDSQPDSVLPKSVTRTPRHAAKPTPAPKNDGPSPEFLAAMAPLMEPSLEKAVASESSLPKVSRASSDTFKPAVTPSVQRPENSALPQNSYEVGMQRITDAIPGAVFGSQQQFNVHLNAGYLDPDQYNRFLEAGKVLKQQIKENPGMRLRFQSLIDLNSDGVRTDIEAGAFAAAMDEQRTFSGKSYAELLQQINDPKLTARALQISEALEATHERLPPDMRQGGHQSPSKAG